MIFSWFRSKKLGDHEKQFNELLNLDNDIFVEVVGEMIAQQHGVSSAMCLVALQNAAQITFALKEYVRKNPGVGLPTTIDDNIRLLSKALDSDGADEINTRRHYWFLFSLMIMRVTEICKKTDPHNASCTRMWRSLIEGGQFLHSSLEHNVLWSHLEKDWFSPVKTEKDGLKFVLNYMLPDWLKKNEAIQQCAELADVRLVAGYFL